jgi:hypothetical protein
VRAIESTNVIDDTSLQDSRDVGRWLNDRADRIGSDCRSLEIGLRSSRDVCAGIGHRLGLRLFNGLGL